MPVKFIALNHAPIKMKFHLYEVVIGLLHGLVNINVRFQHHRLLRFHAVSSPTFTTSPPPSRPCHNLVWCSVPLLTYILFPGRYFCLMTRRCVFSSIMSPDVQLQVYFLMLQSVQLTERGKEIEWWLYNHCGKVSRKATTSNPVRTDGLGASWASTNYQDILLKHINCIMLVHAITDI